MERKVGISIFEWQREYGDHRALELAREAGADAVDFNLCGDEWDYRNPQSVYSKSDEEIIAYFSGLRALADSLGLEISQTHGRITGLQNDEEEDRALYANARLDCLATSALGSPVCVMHGVTTLYMGPDADPRMMRNKNFEMFTTMLPYAKQYGVKIATETFGDAVKYGCCDFFGNVDEFVMSYNRIIAAEDFKDYFCTCVDTGHSNKAVRFQNPPPADAIRMLGSSIAVLHLHDNDGITDQHKFPRTGNIDWMDVLDALDEIGYQGVFNMEVVLNQFGKKINVETAAYAVKLMRNLLKEHDEAKA